MKKLLAVILILCLAFCFACGKKDKTDDSTTGSPSTDTSDTGSGGTNADTQSGDQPSGDNGGSPSGDSQGAGSGDQPSGNTQPDSDLQPLSWTDRIFTGTFTDETVTKDPLVILTVYLPKVSANDDIELYYQGRLDRVKEQAQTTYLDLGRGNYQFASQGIGIFTPITVELGYQVVRNDGKLFSVVRDIYENTGGAHPSITLAAETFRVSDGALMVFSDLFTVSYDDAVARIKPLVEKQMDERIAQYGAEYYFDNAKSDLFNMWDRTDWYITDDTLVLIWQTYAISPYVAGVQEYAIPLREIADIVDAQWIN